MTYLFPLSNGTELGVVSAGTNITITNGVVSTTGGGGSSIGTWTPAITVSTAGTITLTSITANYAKMGQQVICYFDFTLATKAGGANANTLTLTGLPFTSIAGTGNVGNSVVNYFQNLATNHTFLTGTVAGTATTMPLWTVHQATDMTRLTYQDVQAGATPTRLVGTIMYLSAS